MKQQFHAWDFESMRRFVVIKTFRFKSLAVQTFNNLRYAEEYDEIYEWIKCLGVKLSNGYV